MIYSNSINISLVTKIVSNRKQSYFEVIQWLASRNMKWDNEADTKRKLETYVAKSLVLLAENAVKRLFLILQKQTVEQVYYIFEKLY